MSEEQHVLNVGLDPRMLPEYERLRGEINKLSHASRPNVDWELICQMSQQIFEKQGVDLHTAVYFALARSHLHGLRGFTEGCEILANLIVSQWNNFWPSVHQQRARIDILNWFIARVSDVIRQYSISREDKRLLYRCEHALQLMSEKLYHVGLSPVPRVENLVHFIEGYTSLFDESEVVIVSHEQAVTEQNTPISSQTLFYPDVTGRALMQSKAPADHTVKSQEPDNLMPHGLKIIQTRRRQSAWLWFTAGLLACFLPVALFASWFYWNHLNTVRINWALSALEQPVRALPEALNMNQLREIRIALGEQALHDREPQVMAGYQRQLNRVQQMSPLWLYQYADALRYSARILYPDSLIVDAMDTQWQQMIRARQEGHRSEELWISVNRGVDALLAQLLDLERQHKTVTISYLKSAMYNLQKDLNGQMPLSVRLQQLEKKQAANEPLSVTELTMMTDELQSLVVRLYALQKSKEH